MENFTKLRFVDKDFQMDVNLSLVDNSVWLNQKELAMFYNTTKSNISKYITRIFKEGILTVSTVSKLETQSQESNGNLKRKMTFYNLDMIVAIGLKIGSNRGLLLKSFLERKPVMNKTQNIDKVIIYNKGALNIAVFVSPEEETVYMGQSDMAALFETRQHNLITHVFNKVKTNKISVCKDYLHTRSVHKNFLYTGSVHKDFYRFAQFTTIGCILP